MRLLDYINGSLEPHATVDMRPVRNNLVLFFVGVGNPTGDYTLLGHPDFTFADERGLLELTGLVDASDIWRWDGEGNPTDDFGNTITRLDAYSDESKWTELDAEFQG